MHFRKPFFCFLVSILLSFIIVFSACEKEDFFTSHESLKDLSLLVENEEDIKICTVINLQNEDDKKANEKALVSTSKLWAVGQTLRVRFFGGSSYVRAKVMEYARQWEDYANIHFEFVNSGAAEIRISFKDDGSWSYIGKGALGIAQDKASMNFGWFNNNTTNEEFRRTTLHEFGHALGMEHEHQHPAGGIQWNKEAVYEYYAGPPNNWTREEVDRNIFDKAVLASSQFCTYDMHSIMHYSIPNKFTLNNYSVAENNELSNEDKRFMRRIYPFNGNRQAPCQALTQDGKIRDYNGDKYSDIAFHRPGGGWETVPVLFPLGDGRWHGANHLAPSWANQPGVIAIPGDYNADGLEDMAFHRPGSNWNTVPILFSLGNGNWRATNLPEPGWANQPGVVAIPGDFNADGRTDIAFHRPGGRWNTVPILISLGDGAWYGINRPEPGWANQVGAVAIPGDFNSDGRTDIAFHRPGSNWNTLPILFIQGNGDWRATNLPEPGFANQASVIAISGDFNADGRTDIAFHRPGSDWNTLPVLFAQGNGHWRSTNHSEPGYANQPGVVAIFGDFDIDGRADIAFHRPGSSWNTVPILFSKGNGTWQAANLPAPSWANQPGVKAISGDFNSDDGTDIAFYRPGGDWDTVPILFTQGNGAWRATNHSAPSWANQAGVRGIK